MSDPRDEYIARVVRGLTFADVGGLWGTINEKVSVADKHGAKEVTMCDLAPLGSEMWRDFDAHLVKLGLSTVRKLSGDIQKMAVAAAPPQFDVIHCSGVLYHLPSPMQLYIALRKLVRRYLVLTSAITATRIENAAGTLEIPEASAIFVPGLSGRELAILRAHWQPQVGDGAAGITSPVVRWDVENYVPWWWLPTPACMRAMAESAGFVCRDETPSWGGFAHTMLLEAR